MARNSVAVPSAAPVPSARAFDLPLTAKGVGGAVNRMAWPIITENLFQSALGTASMIMVSQLGAAAIAGVGSATQLIFVLQASVGAVTTGTTVLIGRFTGAREPEHASEVLKQSLVVGTIISLVFALLGWACSEWALRAMGAAEDVVHFGTQYLQINAIFGLTMVLMFIVSAALRGAGDSRTPMVVTGGINIINVAASYVLIFGALTIPPMGVVGAAWAAVLSRAVGSAVLLWFVVRGRGRVTVRGLDGWRPNFPLIWRVLRLGLPSMGEQFFMSGGMLLYGIIAISLGTVVYATQRITFQILSMSFMPGMGFAMASTAVVSQYLGAKREDLSEVSGRYAVKMALIWMSVIGVCIAVFGAQIMRIFTDDATMIEIGGHALIIVALAQPMQGMSQVIAGGLRGAGDTRFPMWATFMGVWLIRLPLGYLFGPVLGWGLSGIYISNVIDGGARALATFLRYRSGAWRKIRV